MGVMILYRLGRWCHERRVPVVPQLVYRLIFYLCGAVVPMSVDIGEGSSLAYGGSGVVLHARARVGRNVVIAPQVVLGGRCGHDGVPIIEDDVHIGVGAKILGPVRVGRGARVGANAVVLSDVPAAAAVAGIPARVIRTSVPACTCCAGGAERRPAVVAQAKPAAERWPARLRGALRS
jgi:serine O-acetyltransferase